MKEVFIWTTFTNIGISLSLFGWYCLQAKVTKVGNTLPLFLGSLMVGFSLCIWLAYFLSDGSPPPEQPASQFHLLCPFGKRA